MKFGQRLLFESEGLGFGDHVIGYKKLKRLIKQMVEAERMTASQVTTHSPSASAPFVSALDAEFVKINAYHATQAAAILTLWSTLARSFAQPSTALAAAHRAPEEARARSIWLADLHTALLHLRTFVMLNYMVPMGSFPPAFSVLGSCFGMWRGRRACARL